MEVTKPPKKSKKTSLTLRGKAVLRDINYDEKDVLFTIEGMERISKGVLKKYKLESSTQKTYNSMRKPLIQFLEIMEISHEGTLIKDERITAREAELAWLGYFLGILGRAAGSVKTAHHAYRWFNSQNRDYFFHHHTINPCPLHVFSLT